MHCPDCKAEFGQGLDLCPSCRVALVGSGANNEDGTARAPNTGRMFGNAIGAIVTFQVAVFVFPGVPRLLLAIVAGAVGVLIAEGVRGLYRTI